MKYMFLIYGNEQQWAALSPEAQGQAVAEYGAVVERIAAAGQLVDAGHLAPTFTATTLRHDAPRPTDGPFAETKEALGGFFIVDVEDLDAALAWARQLPLHWDSASVEIRPFATADAPVT